MSLRKCHTIRHLNRKEWLSVLFCWTIWIRALLLDNCFGHFRQHLLQASVPNSFVMRRPLALGAPRGPRTYDSDPDSITLYRDSDCLYFIHDERRLISDKCWGSSCIMDVSLSSSCSDPDSGLASQTRGWLAAGLVCAQWPRKVHSDHPRLPGLVWSWLGNSGHLLWLKENNVTMCNIVTRLGRGNGCDNTWRQMNLIPL